MVFSDTIAHVLAMLAVIAISLTPTTPPTIPEQGPLYVAEPPATAPPAHPWEAFPELLAGYPPPPAEDHLPWIHLHPDQRNFTAFDGCNSGSGTWTRDGEELRFQMGAFTLMSCEGVDTWLQHAHSGVLDGETLHLFDQAGQPLGVLIRRY